MNPFIERVAIMLGLIACSLGAIHVAGWMITHPEVWLFEMWLPRELGKLAPPGFRNRFAHRSAPSFDGWLALHGLRLDARERPLVAAVLDFLGGRLEIEPTRLRPSDRFGPDGELALPTIGPARYGGWSLLPLELPRVLAEDLGGRRLDRGALGHIIWGGDVNDLIEHVLGRDVAHKPKFAAADEFF